MQSSKLDPSIIDRIVVVVPRFTQWTGTRAMHEGDFSVGTGGRLPPKEVTKSLGLKAIIDTQELRVFDRIKHKAEVLLENTGVRYLSGWAIPEDKAEEIFKQLDDLVAQYQSERDAFLGRYDSLVSDWARKNPQFSREILEGKLDAASVAERIRACYETFRLRPVSKERAKELVQSVGGLAGELIASVSRQARTFFKESFLGKTRANRKTVNAVVKLRERLQGLAFLSAAILPVIRLIDEAVAQMPAEGYFSGEPFWKLAALVKTLGDEALLAELIREKSVDAEGEEQSLSTEGEEETVLEEAQEPPDETPEEALLQEAPGDASEPDLFAGLEKFFAESKPQAETVVRQEEEKTEKPNPQEQSRLPEADEAVMASSAAYPAVPEVSVGEGLYF